eukprot:SAG31_NODE_1548_length_7914_cov_5.353423_4_plen_49_part_00
MAAYPLLHILNECHVFADHWPVFHTDVRTSCVGLPETATVQSAILDKQ